MLVLTSRYFSSSGTSHVLLEEMVGHFSGAPFQQMSPYELKSDASCVGLFAFGKDLAVVAGKGNVYCWANSFGFQLGKLVSG